MHEGAPDALVQPNRGLFKLNVVALANSIGDQEILDFKKSCSKYCGLELGYRSTIKVLQNGAATSPPLQCVCFFFINPHAVPFSTVTALCPVCH